MMIGPFVILIEVIATIALVFASNVSIAVTEMVESRGDNC